MPCHDHYPTNEETRANDEIQALKARLDHVTALLCSLSDVHSIGGDRAPQAVKDWWTQHAEDDEAAKAPKPSRKFKVT